MVFQPEKTVAFSGNREMSPRSETDKVDLEERVRATLHSLLLDLYSQGKRSFLVGGALGFDMLAAEVVLELRAQYLELQLVVVVPFEGQEAKYPEAERCRYDAILSAANHVEVISDQGFSMAAYHIRNEFLVANSSLLIAYSNGKGRGAASTIRKAVKCGTPTVNIYEILFGVTSEQQLSLDL